MTDRKGETKRQHYVPRMILRNFSEDGKRISLVLDGKIIRGTGLRDQCQEDYFYGADNVMEKTFASEEGKMAAFLGDLSATRFEKLTPQEVWDLRAFVHWQLFRTRGASEHVSKFSGTFAKEVMRQSFRLNKPPGLDEKDLDLIEVGLEGAQHEALWQAAKSMALLVDLNVKFISTDRTPGFVISDHPVVSYNQFAEHHPIFSRYPTRTGLAVKGLQLFMPVSPSLTLAVFDPDTYEYGGKTSVCRAGPLDVKYLNRMQAVSAHSCFYFDERRMNDSTLADLSSSRKNHPSVYEKHSIASPMIEQDDGQKSQFIMTYRTELTLGAKLSFIRPLDGHLYQDYQRACVPVRSLELVRFSEDFGRQLEGEVERARAANLKQDEASTTVQESA